MKKLTIILSTFLCLGTFFSCSEKDDDSVLNRPIKLKHEAVDLGLPSGLLWATCNVGANSPEEYGDYFAWGETEPKATYTWENLKYRVSGDSSNNLTFSKYVTHSLFGTVDNKTELEPKDDAAHVNWGGAWRMPTKAELDELRTKCTWIWTTQNDVNGYKVVGPNGNSIFLPAAGFRDGSSSIDVGSYGGYWSRSLYTSYNSRACCLYFDSSGVDWDINNRRGGRSVRAVRGSE